MIFDFSNYVSSSFELPNPILIYPGLQLYVTMEVGFSSVTVRGMLPNKESVFDVYLAGAGHKSEAERLMEDLDTALQFSPKKDPEMFL